MSRLFTLLQYLLPHHLLSAIMYKITRIEWVPLKNYMIRRVIALYNVDMADAVESHPESYASFNEFFTRALKPEARPVAEGDDIACPADGQVSQAGDIRDGRIFQAKNHSYSLLELLGGNQPLADLFSEGKFATIYLSPRDYHRIHMPLSGELQSMVHVPGRLFSVNQATTHDVPRLFARNERLVTIFQTAAGPMAVILVGAIFVSSIDTVWAGTITPEHNRLTYWQYQQAQPVLLSKGHEMGRFNMGSTVIVLLPQGAADWNDSLVPGEHVRMGQAIGSLASETPGIETET
ncbi:MAG: archaetidylserine decarboxylase [Chromatiales bacterium]|jgi:phosphatidylserine decarboxylase